MKEPDLQSGSENRKETKMTRIKYNHVLLVDDAELDNFVSSKLLLVNHFAKKIYMHTSGESALEFLNGLTVSEAKFKTYPEVIFVDINMPLMNGFQFIDSLRQAVVKQGVKLPRLVILTSSVFQNDKTKAQNVLPDIIFTIKPLTKEMLDEI
jgi:CheY-like chemotaxis protein